MNERMKDTEKSDSDQGSRSQSDNKSPSVKKLLNVTSEQECKDNQEEKIQPVSVADDNVTEQKQSLTMTAFEPHPAAGGIVENNQTQVYLVDANAITNLKAGSQYVLVPIKEEKQELQCFDNNQDGTNSAEKGKQAWNAECSPLQKHHQHVTVVKADDMPSSSASNHSDSIKIVQVESQHTDKENASTSLITLSPVESRVFENNEKNSDVSTQQSSEDIIKNVTFATLSPLCQIQQYGQQRTPCFENSHFQHYQRLSSEICCPMSSTPHQAHSVSSDCTTQDNTTTSSHSGHSRSTPSSWHPPFIWSPHHSVESSHGHNVATPSTPSSSSNIRLNSSGEEVESISPEYPRVPHNTPNSCEVTRMSIATLNQVPQMIGPLDNVPYYLPFNGRENHNEKERKRRNRIKNACQSLRTLVPGLSDKTDKATVFEFTVQYLMHLKRHVGTSHDKEFMQKYSPY